MTTRGVFAAYDFVRLVVIDDECKAITCQTGYKKFLTALVGKVRRKSAQGRKVNRVANLDFFRGGQAQIARLQRNFSIHNTKTTRIFQPSRPEPWFPPRCQPN
jgi:hypothetical protein